MGKRWSLQNKKVLITGATKGIGAAIVKEFADFGAELIIIARNKDKLNTMVNEYSEKGIKISGVAADVSKRNDYKEILEGINNERGELDIFVNNVGTNIRKSAENYSFEDYDFIMNTNLRSAFELSRLLYPFLKQIRFCHRSPAHSLQAQGKPFRFQIAHRKQGSLLGAW